MKTREEYLEKIEIAVKKYTDYESENYKEDPSALDKKLLAEQYKELEETVRDVADEYLSTNTRCTLSYKVYKFTRKITIFCML